MIDSPLDGGEVVRFGNTLHGLMNATTQRVEIGGVERPLPAAYQAWRDFSGSAGIQGADFGDTHLVRVPGVAPLGMSPEELAAELAAGRAWQNYALLSGPHQMVFGHPLSGWIYIDEAGGRWLVRQSGGPSIINYGQVGVAQSLGITLSITPFGDIGAEPVSPIHVQASLADIGQANPPGVTAERGDVLHLRVTSISSHGRRAIIALYPLRIAGTQMIDYDPRDLPYGWLSLELSGSGQAIAATLAVLRTRTQALGQRIRSTPVSQPLKAALTLTGGCSISGDRVVGSWSASAELVPHGAGLPSLIGTDTGYFYNHQLENRDELDHRIVCLVFDDADDVREISVTATAVTLEAASTELSAGGSYAIDSVLINGVPVSGRPVTGSVSLSITRGIQRDTEVSMAIMVDGVIVDSYSVESTESAVESYSVELGSEFSGGAAQMYGHYFGGSVFYDINSGTATDMRGVNAYTDAIPPSLFERETVVSHGQSIIDAHADLASTQIVGISAPFSRVGIRHSRDGLAIEIIMQRLCNQLLMPRIERFVGAASTPSSAESYAVITPHGAELAAQPGGISRRLVRGSYEPIKRRVYAGHSNDQGQLGWHLWI